MDKKEKYSLLVKDFKKYTFKDQSLINPFSVHGAPNELNPWAVWHGNLDAKILFIGQDFSNEFYLNELINNNWEKEKNSITNKHLNELFKLILVDDIGMPTEVEKALPLYFTNAVLGIKKGTMQEPIKPSQYKETAKEYLGKLINIVEPKYIIAMSEVAYKAICFIYNKTPLKTMKEAIEKNGIDLLDGKTLFVVAHCSANGRRNRDEKQQELDWKAIKPKLIF